LELALEAEAVISAAAVVWVLAVVAPLGSVQEC